MFLEQLKTAAHTLTFQEVIAYIENHYSFTPTAFKNGEHYNEAHENMGSCKIFSFAKIMNLNAETTLQLFGDFYRTDVLLHPEAENHQNIRNFMRFGWEGIHFEGNALIEKR